MSRNRQPRRFLPAVEALEDRRLPAVLLPALTVGPIIGPALPVSVLPAPVPSLPTASAPVAFGSQDALIQFLIKDALVRYKDLFGKSGGVYPPGILYPYYADGLMRPMALADSTQTGDFSSTNVQVQGVDEGDLVKTDGNYLYLISGGDLVIMQAQPAGDLHVLSRTALEGQASALYLDGDRVVVLSSVWPPFDSGDNSPLLRTYWNVTKLTVLDVSDRTAPRTVWESYADGRLLTSRAVGDRVYLVLDSSYAVLPGPIMHDDGGQYTYETQDQYLARIAGHELDLALPRFCTRPGGVGTRLQPAGFLTDPAALYQPGTVNDTDLVSVLTFDVTSDRAAPVGGASAYAGYGSVVYANADHIDVVSPVWNNWQQQGSVIDQFSLNGDGVTLTARGVVPGSVLGQYSLDESGGYLRIATQVGWGAGASSAVYVLAPKDGVLSVVGSVEGLGAGEWLRSVRFLGDRAYLCTSESWDPVYVIDLGDPTAPRLAGELKMPGYSSYLQPLDATHLLGVGRDAPHGVLRLALFDVTDPTAPVLVDQYVIAAPSGEWPGATSSLAEFDPHALSYFPETHTLAIPVSVNEFWFGLPLRAASLVVPVGIFPIFSPAACVSQLEVFQVDPATGFHHLGNVDQGSPVLRSLRIGDTLYSVATDTVKAVPLDDPSAPGTEARLTDKPRSFLPVLHEATAGTTYDGEVLEFTVTDPTGLTATVWWGDGQSSAGEVVALGGSRYAVHATHTYANPGSFVFNVSFSRDGMPSPVGYFSGWVDVSGSPASPDDGVPVVGPVQGPGTGSPPTDPGPVTPPNPAPQPDPPKGDPGQETAPGAASPATANPVLVQALAQSSGSSADVSGAPGPSPQAAGSAAAPAVSAGNSPAVSDGASPYDQLSGAGSSVSADLLPADVHPSGVSESGPGPQAPAAGTPAALTAVPDASFEPMPLQAAADTAAEDRSAPDTDSPDDARPAAAPAVERDDGGARSESPAATGALLLLGMLSAAAASPSDDAAAREVSESRRTNDLR